MTTDDRTKTPHDISRLQPIDTNLPVPDAHYWQYCVNCGTKLDSRKCKLICHTCGFYHSCSEP